MNTKPKPFVFVLMPFDDNFKDVYCLGIKPACEKAGVYAERLDDQIYQESMLDRIYNQIAKADVIVADMTGRNPNVFYEVGYAHALGKKVILITKDANDIPFDLKHYRHIEYGDGITGLLPELEKHVRWALEQPDNASLPKGPMLDIYHDGRALIGEPTVQVKLESAPFGSMFERRFDLKFDVHNAGVRREVFRVALVTPPAFSADSVNLTSVRLPSDELLHSPPQTMGVMAEDWASFTIGLRVHDGVVNARRAPLMKLRVISEQGFMEFPFSVRPLDKQTAKPE